MGTKRRKLGSGSTNVINSLPDEILALIVSYLPTKQAIATSLLSKRWRYLFPLMNQIFACQHHFYLDDSDLFYPEKNGTREREDHVVQQSFRDFVDKLLSDCNTIKKLSLICRDRRITFALIDQWIFKALERGLIDLDLRLKKISYRMVMHLPYSKIFTSKKLVKLTLEVEVNLTLIVYPEVFLPMLKSLVLLGVWFKAERLCRVMLPGCPILEELSLLEFSYTHLFHKDEPPLVISHKTLKTLRVQYNDCIEFPRFMTLETPSLVYLDYSGFHPLHCSKASFLDSLVEAKLDVVMDHEDCIFSDIFTWTRNVKTLSLSSASVKMMYLRGWRRLPIFSDLIKLSFESNTREGWKLLPRLLSKCPKLETLVLKGFHCARKEEVSIDENEVKVLVIYGFRGSGREFRRLKWFLCQMKFLQVVKVRFDADDNKKLKLINHLLDLPNLPECSSKCQIQVL